MSRTVAIGIQNFEELRNENYFYIDKTSFIKEWWESGDSVTLITRPRRFGKTLNMSMLEQFFSVEYAGRKNLFEGLSIWEEEKSGVKSWYDGFVFGDKSDIYNPWSIIIFLDKKRYGTYWTNSSSNRLVSKLIQEGSKGIKVTFEKLLKGGNNSLCH